MHYKNEDGCDYEMIMMFNLFVNHLLGIRKPTIAATVAATIAKYVRAVLFKRRLGNMILTSWYRTRIHHGLPW